MAKKSSKADSFQTIRRAITRFVDASRRLFIAAERQSPRFTATPVDGVDWAFLADLLHAEIITSLVAVERAVDALRDEMETAQTPLSPEWTRLANSAWRIGKWACDDARVEGWFDGRFARIVGDAALGKLKFATDLAVVVLDAIEESMLPPTQRKILQALLNESPLKADELALRTCRLESTNASFRTALGQMVKDGLLLSGGKGQGSPGYNLTDRGIRLASNVLTFEGCLK